MTIAQRVTKALDVALLHAELWHLRRRYRQLEQAYQHEASLRMKSLDAVKTYHDKMTAEINKLSVAIENVRQKLGAQEGETALQAAARIRAMLDAALADNEIQRSHVRSSERDVPADHS